MLHPKEIVRRDDILNVPREPLEPRHDFSRASAALIGGQRKLALGEQAMHKPISERNELTKMGVEFRVHFDTLAQLGNELPESALLQSRIPRTALADPSSGRLGTQNVGKTLRPAPALGRLVA